jgi:hypothetical protein
MQELKGNLWDLAREMHADAICITTNGFVKNDGTAVMGKGCAREACQRYPNLNLPLVLGQKLASSHNHVHKLGLITANEPTISGWSHRHLLSFPVKPERALCQKGAVNVVAHMRGQFQEGSMVPGWACKADLKLIEQSCHNLVRLVHNFHFQLVLMPRPGCGAGELEWHDVRPILREVLGSGDDRYIVVTWR